MNKCLSFIDFLPLFLVLVFVFICEELTEIVPSELSNSDFKANIWHSAQADLSLYCKDLKNINAVDARGNTALMYASSANSSTCVDYLIKNGADVNIRNTDGETALLIACIKNGFCSSAFVLVKSGADVSVKNKLGYSVWKCALLGERLFWAHFLDTYCNDYDYCVENNFLKDFYLRLEYYILGGTCCPYHQYREHFQFEKYF